ncbi:uracil-DNA glycosylase [Candidatus Purcelliella pentastirinorum]|nr:uracil-DNA glycosylase [Candidatus Purcelliella pentastirinorum]WDI78769.1 uracil-DNA glycosylase [Candidatus Purcelliella pentastirinorum]WDR79903.1 uracil-DNA glycosylase [Candidatus Purcelliella pentastirinorum]
MNVLLKWKDLFYLEKSKKYFRNIFYFLNKELSLGKNFYPNKRFIFNAFRFTEFDKLKVVILGQDPYYGYNQANGLAFSVNIGVRIPPSLKNIYKELYYSFLNFNMPSHGYLYNWAKQGVFLLNSILTVEAGKANSHSHIGWQRFTDIVIYFISKYKNNVVFLLWGNYAQKKINLINLNKHYVLTSSHPSPMSANISFLGCNHFIKANKFLVNKNINPIDWVL